MNETAIANLSVAVTHAIVNASRNRDSGPSLADRFYGWVAARRIQPLRRR